MAAVDASTWLNENMMKWLGEKNAADTLSNLHLTILLRKWAWSYWMLQM